MSSEARLKDPLEKSAVPEASGPSSENIPLADIEAAIRSIRHGMVQVIIQDGIVVQIDRTEKLRLRPGKPTKAREAA